MFLVLRHIWVKVSLSSRLRDSHGQNLWVYCGGVQLEVVSPSVSILKVPASRIHVMVTDCITSLSLSFFICYMRKIIFSPLLS